MKKKTKVIGLCAIFAVAVAGIAAVTWGLQTQKSKFPDAPTAEGIMYSERAVVRRSDSDTVNIFNWDGEPACIERKSIFNLATGKTVIALPESIYEVSEDISQIFVDDEKTIHVLYFNPKNSELSMQRFSVTGQAKSEKISLPEWQGLVAETTDTGAPYPNISKLMADQNYVYIQSYGHSGGALQIFTYDGEPYSQQKSITCFDISGTGELYIAGTPDARVRKISVADEAELYVKPINFYKTKENVSKIMLERKSGTVYIVTTDDITTYNAETGEFIEGVFKFSRDAKEVAFETVGDFFVTESKTIYITAMSKSSDRPKYYVYSEMWSFSDHTDPQEDMYKTVLADLSDFGKSKPVFATTENAMNITWRKFEGFGVAPGYFKCDVRSADISNEDLSVLKNLTDISFNTDTVWPAKLPEGFDPVQMLENNKNPGLGIRALHEQGITGKGVSMAIIGQGLLLDHEQYKDNLMSYEKIHCSDDVATMGGTAVASIAVGKDIGVAPDAKLYYIATTHSHWTGKYGDYIVDASVTAEAVLRVLEINKQLPENEKIRVVTNGRGYGSSDKGYAELMAAIDQANEENVVVITVGDVSNTSYSYGGVEHDYFSDPDDPTSYRPADWVKSEFYLGRKPATNTVQVPMGVQTHAGNTGTSDYEITRPSGASWSATWIAGFYALCCEVKPDITANEFMKTIGTTATPTQITHEGKQYNLGRVINPTAAIEELQSRVAK